MGLRFLARLGLAGRRPDDGGDRPLPALAGGAAVQLLQRTDDVLAGHDDQVLVAGCPMGTREFVAHRRLGHLEAAATAELARLLP